MTKGIVFVLVLIMTISLVACGSGNDLPSVSPIDTSALSEDLDYTITKDRMEDLDYLCAELKKRHKNIYHSISEDEFLAEKERIAANVATLSDVEFFYELKRLVALIGDAHTYVAFTPSAHDYMHPLPIGPSMIDGGWYLQYTDKAHEKYLGWQIIAINEFPLEEVFDRLSRLNNHENQVVLEDGIVTDLCFIDSLKYLDISKDLTSVEVALSDPITGSKETVEFSSYEGKDIFNAEMVFWQTEVLMASMEADMYLAKETSEDSYLIQYNTCAEDESYPISEFSNQIEADINNKSYKKIIVDLRYNGGGNSSVLWPVIDMLENRQAEQGFTVYILIGRGTYSSAVLNAVELKQRLNGVFVGTPTKGSLNHYGEVEVFNLPNFPAHIAYSTKYFEFMPEYGEGSINPDIPVTTTYEDVVAGIDRELQVVVDE